MIWVLMQFRSWDTDAYVRAYTDMDVNATRLTHYAGHETHTRRIYGTWGA